MALRPSSAFLRSVSRSPASVFFKRSFQTSTRFMQTQTETQKQKQTTSASALPVKKPIGAFRGSIFGFLLGSTLAAYGMYSYVLKEYKVSNELLTEDIYAMQAVTQRLNEHVTELEGKLDVLEKKKKL